MLTVARNVAAETLGTFLFVFAIITAIANAGDLTPFAVGLALMVLVYAFGHISGGHFNPAVSLGALVRGALSARDFVFYVVGQAVGAAVAVAVAALVVPPATEAVQIDLLPAFVAELVVTFTLVTVVLNVATSKDHPNNSFYGLAIGATVLVGALAVGPISGGGFNPAVALGLAINGTFAWSNFWLYLLAPLVGGLLAGLVFRALNADDRITQEA
ncbi:MIP/aquaporin family protein [Leucobacter chromiireducens]|uniref:MIP/aquaporin family protein n=1 Tax=Leucobacter chromiireducens TaxID=283877 RepID=UPI000F644A47|nr:aquaporin [Leucobacter chromiireducens]